MHDPIPLLGVADPISMLSHALGAICFALLGLRLLRQARGDRLRLYSILIYVGGVVFALSASSLAHALARESDARRMLMIIDHAAIFFLIAASYTPVHILKFQGVMRWGVLIVVWAAALFGMIAKSLYFTQMPEWLGLSLYLGLGWTGLVSATGLYLLAGLKPLYPLIGGAVAYTTGAALEFARVPTLASGIIGPHEVFHLFVLAGIGMHWVYISKAVAHSRHMLLGHTVPPGVSPNPPTAISLPT